MPIPLSESWRHNILWTDTPRRDDINDRIDALENRIERYGVHVCDEMLSKIEVRDGCSTRENP